MYLKHLSVVNFKNLEQVDLDFSPKLNCFIGDNGEGKTNLLEAVYFLSMTKSSLGVADSHHIRYGEEFFMLQGKYERKDVEETIYCGLKKGGVKILKRNGKEYEKLSQHIGFVPLVMVSPLDTVLIQESGEERRKYLNAVISQFDAEYLDSLMKYNRALQQRNKLLKNKTGRTDYDVVESLDFQLANYGKVIYNKRKELIEQILPTFQSVYQAISKGKEEVMLTYESALDKADLLSLLQQVWDKDQLLQHTTVGIHRDDLNMLISGNPIRKTGSQGQQKTFLIALKLAQFELMKQKTGLYPILLLDDIFDKLDLGRVEELIHLVTGDNFGQIFLTDSNKTRLDAILQNILHPNKLFVVKTGAVSLPE